MVSEPLFSTGGLFDSLKIGNLNTKTIQKQENSGSSDNSEDENGNAVNISDNIESDLDDPEETSSSEEEDLLDSTDEEDMEGTGQGEVSNQDVL